jgi:hypothetical protein
LLASIPSVQGTIMLFHRIIIVFAEAVFARCSTTACQKAQQAEGARQNLVLCACEVVKATRYVVEVSTILPRHQNIASPI